MPTAVLLFLALSLRERRVVFISIPFFFSHPGGGSVGLVWQFGREIDLRRSHTSRHFSSHDTLQLKANFEFCVSK